MVRKRKDGHDDQRFKDAWSDKKSQGYQPDGNWWSWMIFILTLGILDFRTYVDKKNGKYKDPLSNFEKSAQRLKDMLDGDIEKESEDKN